MRLWSSCSKLNPNFLQLLPFELLPLIIPFILLRLNQIQITSREEDAKDTRNYAFYFIYSEIQTRNEKKTSKIDQTVSADLTLMITGIN